MIVAEYIIYEALYGVEKELAAKIIPEIKKDEKYLLAACNCVVLRKTFLRLYRFYQPIEQLGEVEKKELKSYVLINFPGKPVNWLTDTCRIVYTIGNII